MKKRIIPRLITCLLCCNLVAILSSCGDFWTIDTAELTNDTKMGLSRSVVTIMEGDRYAIPVWFQPDTLPNRTVFWESEDNSIATFDHDTLLAVSPGLTRAMATSAMNLLTDTCWVQVLPNPEMDWGDFPYEMLLYASVTLHGTPLTTENQDRFIIAAYVGDDLRGVGQVRQAHGIDYFTMRIGAYRPAGDYIRLRCYYRGEALAEWFPQLLLFDGEAHGTLSSLFPLMLDDHAEVYKPDVDTEPVEDDNPYIVIPDTITWVVTD